MDNLSHQLEEEVTEMIDTMHPAQRRDALIYLGSGSMKNVVRNILEKASTLRKEVLDLLDKVMQTESICAKIQAKLMSVIQKDNINK